MKNDEENSEVSRRRLILLENKSDPTIIALNTILESPLGLAKEIAFKCFQKDESTTLFSYKNGLDILKRLGVGLESAMNKSTYPIANYSSYLFAFQQFVHSSYRARQGNFAESLLRAILKETSVKVYGKKEHSNIVQEVLGTKTTNKHDVDVIASTSTENLFVQIRSRDDTGGTTAKGSLAEFLKDVLRNNIIPSKPIRYVIFVWVSGSSSQKSSLITRIIDQLTGLTPIETEEMKNDLSSQKRIKLSENLTLELSYGFEAFSAILAEFSESETISEISKRIFTTLEDWDDLWLTYALSSIELQNLSINGMNNFLVLDDKLKKLKININKQDINDYENRSNAIAHKLIEEWDENTLPVNSARDQLWYIRDLILVKMIFLSDERTSSRNKDPPPNDEPDELPQENIQSISSLNTKSKISFRRLVKSVPSTTYASHGMYYYPAKFIPQVVRWAIERYTSAGDSIIDPFAGSGTVCVEALITGRNATCIDLTPMLKYLIDGKTYRSPLLEELLDKAKKIIKSETEYTPKWSKITYWYPPEIYQILSKMWGGYQENEHPLLLLSLLKVSRRFSYGDSQVPKLFKSKRKEMEITSLMNTDYSTTIHKYFVESVKQMYNYSKEFTKLYKGGKINLLADTDMVNYNLDAEYDLLITSPPYGQAHEYIRSVKLELGWLGYDDQKIRELGKHEIPYNRDVPDIEIHSKTLEMYLQTIDGKIRKYATTYFKSVLYILDKCLRALKPSGTAAIFVGNATFSGVEFPFHDIFREHFESNGFQFELLLEDEIVGRRLFRGRKNLSPNGMGFEYLLIMRKPPIKVKSKEMTIYGAKPLF
ncbi:MAG: DNA methyltransferase [Thermoplasmatales archaeon]